MGVTGRGLFGTWVRPSKSLEHQDALPIGGPCPPADSPLWGMGGGRREGQLGLIYARVRTTAAPDTPYLPNSSPSLHTGPDTFPLFTQAVHIF